MPGIVARMATSQHRGEAVLVVDDDQAQREMLAEMFHLEGFATSMAPNGAEALACLRAGMPVDVILLDLRMPVMDGWAFLVAQRQDPALAKIPVVVTTAEFPAHAADLHANAIFSKPLDFTRLIACVRGLCEPGRGLAGDDRAR